MEVSSEEREMEVEALQSIYGEQFSSVVGSGIDENLFYEVKLQQSDIKIIFTIPEKYPDIPPSISVVTQENQSAYAKLESLLYDKANKNCGEVMIYNLIEEATCWLEKLNLAKQVSLQRDENVSEDGSTICKFFLEGKCKFGNKCRNKHNIVTSSKSVNRDESLHSKLSSGTSENVIPVPEHKEMTNGDLKMDNKSPGIRYHERKECDGSKKKPSMKTASDVISRIKWDEELSPKDFTVGYLDRFLGIMEKCFADFSWEDLASVDHFVDLAIPRHRIQYFKYLGEMVWDKRERVDKVFGSTGSKETILDVKQRIGGSGGKNEVQEDGKEESAVDDISCNLSELPKQLKGKSGPNYFIALQISDQEVLDNINKIQSDIYSELGPEAGLEQTPNQRLHLTLLMLTLRSEDEVTTAKNILKSVQPVLISILPPSHKLRFSGLGQFHNRILYASVEPDVRLSKLVQVLNYKFTKAGISLEGNRSEFVPHVTIMKVTSKDFTNQENIQKKLSTLVATDHKIGEQSVPSIVLFSRILPKDIDGAHHKVSTVENSVKSLSSTLPKKLLQLVDRLFETGKLCDDERVELRTLLQCGDAVKLDEGIAWLSELGEISNDKTVVILRGIPGSGKTHLVQNSVEAHEQKGYVYCSAKQLFHKTGSFIPDITELNIAEAYCRTCFMDAIATEQCFVVVDGIHSKCWEYAVYKYLAHAFGYRCHVLEIRVTKPEEIKWCLQSNTSGAHMEELLETVQEWEDDPDAVVTEPWFMKRETLIHEPLSLKNLLLKN